MSILYELSPEVAGGLGEFTIMGTEEEIRNGEPSAEVRYLHYEFDGWLGDHLLTTNPCYLISKQLEMELRKTNLSGYEIKDCLVTVSELFLELQAETVLPSFVRFLPKGTVILEENLYSKWSGDPFCLTPGGSLVVTKEGLSILRTQQLDICDIQVLFPKP